MYCQLKLPQSTIVITRRFCTRPSYFKRESVGLLSAQAYNDDMCSSMETQTLAIASIVVYLSTNTTRRI